MKYNFFLSVFASFFVVCAFSFEPGYLVDHIDRSIEKANELESKVDGNILEIPGMSSDKVRHVLNNICSLEGINYFEVGLFKGSTFFSALFKNESMNSAKGVDIWVSNTAEDFYKNFEKFKSYLPEKVVIIEKDCFSIAHSELEVPVHVYFYDGRHKVEDQYKAFSYFDDVFDSTFIAIVDDWNVPHVQTSTRAAFKDLGYKIHKEWTLPANGNGDRVNWWNGIYMAVIEKTK